MGVGVSRSSSIVIVSSSSRIFTRFVFIKKDDFIFF